jgi:hypothetical protein
MLIALIKAGPCFLDWVLFKVFDFPARTMNRIVAFDSLEKKCCYTVLYSSV